MTQIFPAAVLLYLERLGSVVATRDGVGSSQDGCASVECGLDASLGDGDGLLLHGFVDGHLIPHVHLVKLIDAAHALCKEAMKRTSYIEAVVLTLSANIRAPASMTNS